MDKKRFSLPYLESVRHQRNVCFAEQIRSANRAITKLYNKYLDEVDIGITQFSLLIRLYYFDAISVAKLAEDLETDRTTLIRNVKILERSGHIEVFSSETGRTKLVRISSKGIASLERALPLWLTAQSELREKLGDDIWNGLFGDLRTLVDEASKDEPKKVF